MTTKDMNLSLGREPIRSKATASAKAAPKNLGKTPDQEQTEDPARYRGTTSTWNWNWQLFAFAALAIANIAFMLLTGPWLTQQTVQPATKTDLPVTEQLSNQLIQVTNQLTSLRQDFKRLQLTVNEQQQLIISTSADITEKTKGFFLETQKTPVKADPVVSAAALKPWYINLGNFPERSEAVTVQQQVKSLGYNADISSVTIPNEPDGSADTTTGYQLRITGFEDQESAEATAARIMDSSELNGLWVWKKN
jgi:hypothetical protein